MLLAALWISTATSAFAQAACTYNPATNTVAITIDPGAAGVLAVEGDGANLDPASPNGAILLLTAGGWSSCGSASNSNTASILVLGSPSTAEQFVLQNAIGDQFSTSIAWNIDLGSGSPDVFRIDASEDKADTLTLGDVSFDLNGGGGAVLGTEVDEVFGDDKNDFVDASLLTSVMLKGNGGPLEDTIIGGVADDQILGGPDDDTKLIGADGDDKVEGEGGDDLVDEGPASNGTDSLTGGVGGENDCGDTVAYPRTVSVNISSDGLANDGEAGEFDLVQDFEILVAGSSNDTLSDTLVIAQRFQGGDGDDVLTGNGDDRADFSTSAAAVSVDLGAGVAVGAGTDVIAGVNGVIGSPGDDTIIGSAGGDRLSGGGGDDTINGGAGNDRIGDNAAISAFPNCPDDNEFGNDALRGGIGTDVLRGGPGTDSLSGGAGNDLLNGGTGDDALKGGPGNDILIGGPGNDVCLGGPGNDTFIQRNP
jgi:Ca2+-binding RTX toxin-like protein